MNIECEKDAAKHINKMSAPLKQRVKKAIEKLPSGDVAKLQGLSGDYRLRVGDLRVLFFRSPRNDNNKGRFAERAGV